MLKSISKALVAILFFSLFSVVLHAQTNPPLIDSIQSMMLKHYVFLDKAKAVNTHLNSLVANEKLNSDDPVAYAKALSLEMQSITDDKHLNVAPPRPRNNRTPVGNTHIFDRHISNLERFRSGGFREIGLFEGNIGYLRIENFRVEDMGQIDPAMDFLSTADALILDVRGNGGGNGPGVNYLSSYFLPDSLLLSSLYIRSTDQTENYFTQPVKGQKRLDLPLYILTNNRTFSAAEAFAYDLQARGRAIVIGDQTGGGAHPVRFMPLPGGYRLIIPVARSINPITQTNWEGVGVTPNVNISAQQALDTAKVLAKKAAKTYRHELFDKLKMLLEKENIVDQKEIDNLLMSILERKHMEDHMVVGTGYRYMTVGNLSAAKAIMSSATRLFPNDAMPMTAMRKCCRKLGKERRR